MLKTLSPSRASQLKSRCLVTETGCWEWQGPKTRSGYGHTSWHNKTVSTHRLMYMLLVGEIEDGNEVHHTCSNRLCINPEHLQSIAPQRHREIPKLNRRSDAVLSGLEIARAVKAENAKQRTHCRRGHPRTEENVRMYQGRRYCKACHAENTLKYYHDRKAAASPAVAITTPPSP